ncbi:MAG: AAA family ATPase [Kofleriaceae bacterium]
MRHGLVLGKFMPPHVGHVHLCEVARAMTDELWIVVASLPSEPIAGAQRVAWMRELVPGARVFHLAAELPQEPSDHPAFWELWRTSLLALLPCAPDRVFTSDAYGKQLAAELGAIWIPVDPGRTVFATSGSAIRHDPLASWSALPRCVRPYYVKRISVFGPESTGKSTLATALAHELGTVAVPEFARGYLEARGGALVREDLDVIGEGQIALEDALAFEARRFLFCDTDPLLTIVWAEALFGDASPWLRALAPSRRYDLTLLCDLELPWVDDVVRYLPEDRARFFDRCEDILRGAERPYAIIRGHGPGRLAAARSALNTLGVT